MVNVEPILDVRRLTKCYPGANGELTVVKEITFSLLPAENATGNWVKVVQRLPVRLSFDKLDSDHPLAAGLSVTVDVDTEFHRPWLDRINRMFAWLAGRPTQTAER